MQNHIFVPRITDFRCKIVFLSPKQRTFNAKLYFCSQIRGLLNQSMIFVPRIEDFLSKTIYKFLHCNYYWWTANIQLFLLCNFNKYLFIRYFRQNWHLYIDWVFHIYARYGIDWICRLFCYLLLLSVLYPK